MTSWRWNKYDSHKFTMHVFGYSPDSLVTKIDVSDTRGHKLDSDTFDIRTRGGHLSSSLS